MMSYGPSEISQFFASRARKDLPALEAIKDLMSRNILTSDKSDQVMRHSQKFCAAAGVKINEITSGELAKLWSSDWIKHFNA